MIIIWVSGGAQMTVTMAGEARPRRQSAATGTRLAALA